MRNRILGVAATLIVSTVALTGCISSDYQDRKERQQEVQIPNSLGKQNQEERLKREEDTNAIRYVYLMSFGQIIGYYTIQGKVSPASTQIAPEQEIICRTSSSESCQAVDSAKDDGTYGPGDEGSFFFTTDGVLVETTLDYIQSDAPISIDVPRLDG